MNPLRQILVQNGPTVTYLGPIGMDLLGSVIVVNLIQTVDVIKPYEIAA